MDELSGICEPEHVGLDPGEITSAKLIHQKHGNRLYRVECGTRSFVLKWFNDPSQTSEVRCYTLLEGLGVQTLPVHGRTENALLLEDLTTSTTWRLAEEGDVNRLETGVAVAEWYLALHAAGRRILEGPKQPPSFLKREVDALNADGILDMGKRLGLDHDSVWRLAADHIESLKSTMKSLPETINYNDFHWTNLALSRRQTPSFQAVVFDYHMLGIGLPYSDCRNVVSALGGQAVDAFWETYGPASDRERLLDEPLALLYALSYALRLPKLPGWAQGCLRQVQSGELERSLLRAIEIV